MDLKHEYEWVKQANGNYTILNVPVFGLVDDEVERGDGKKIKRFVGSKELDKTVARMNQEKSRGWYPRLMISHHDDNCKDNLGVGFADNFYTDGEILFCNFVEVSPVTFQRMYERNAYPHRSVEYCFRENLIESIALLDTRKPYMRFPVMNLCREETHSFFDSNEINRFYDINNKDKEVFIMTVLKQKTSLEDIISSAVKDAVAKNFSGLTQFQMTGNENSQLPQGENSDEFYSKFKSCMKKFMDEEMDQYMSKYMENKKECAPEVVDSTAKMSDSSFKGHDSAGKISQKFFPEKNNFLSKFEMEEEEIRSVAFMASKDWEDTVGQKDRTAAKKFYEMNPDKEKFVNDAVMQEKAVGGSYEKLWRGGK